MDARKKISFDRIIIIIIRQRRSIVQSIVGRYVKKKRPNKLNNKKAHRTYKIQKKKKLFKENIYR